MGVSEISELPLLEKFQIMEAIWADLSARVDQIQIPPEHLQLLEERRARVASGKTELLNWDDVKHTIGRK